MIVFDEKRTLSCNGEDVGIREGYLVNENYQIHLTLLREYADDVKDNECYQFKYLMKMIYNGD